MAEQVDVLVIGGGPAGRTVARTIRKKRSDMTVTVIKEDEVNPNRCVIPYIYDDTVPVPKGMIPNTLVTEVGASLRVGRVESIDSEGKRVTLQGGDVIEYGHLVLAMGSTPIIPEIAGVELEGVLVVRTTSDVEALMKAREGAKRAVVIGMGLIGAEVAASLRRAGLEVTGIDMLTHCLGAALDDDFAERADAALRGKDQSGVKLELGRQVEAILGDEQGRVRAVKTDGCEFSADMVVLAVGVRPAQKLAEQAGAEVGRGIVTDAQQRTTLADVYAVGDCVQSRCMLSGRPRPSQLGTTAVIQAKVAARTILGKPAAFKGTLASWACQLEQLALGGIGLRPEEAKQAGFEIIVGESKTLSQYPQMPHVQTVHTRLVFEDPRGTSDEAKAPMRLLGGQISGTFAVAGYLDLLSLAISKRLTAGDLAALQYATHPELAPKPSDNLIVMAAMDALTKLGG
jgi:NADH oxidase (H2O2-forming)